MTFIEGEPLDEVGYLAPPVLRAHGALAASVARALEGFDHPALDRSLQWDLRHASDVVEALAPFASTPARRALLERSTAIATGALAPLVPDLRIAVVHQDVTEANTVARRDPAGHPMPAGLIDFGDLSRTWIAGDLAVVVAADVIHDVAHPLQVAREVTRGYAVTLPLIPTEVAAVWPLVVARAASVAISGDQQASLEPDNAYVADTRDDEWSALEAVVDVPFALAEAVLRDAAGLPPVDRPMVNLTTSPVLGDAGDTEAIDLSTTSTELDGAAIGRPGAAGDLVRRVAGRRTAAHRPLGRGSPRGHGPRRDG